MERKRDGVSIIGMVILVTVILAIGFMFLKSKGIIGGKSDLTYVTFVLEHRNGTSDTAIIGYKDGIIYEHTWETSFPKDVWTEEELDEMIAQYKIYANENKHLKFYKVRTKETDTHVIISEIYTGLEKEKNREALVEIGWLEDAEPKMYSELENELLSGGYVKK